MLAMDEEHELTYADIETNIKRNLSSTLAQTFDEIAKIAMRASADFSTEVPTKSVMERLQNAHSVVTLIIDEAMRGLGTATKLGMGVAVVTTLKDHEEPEDSFPR